MDDLEKRRRPLGGSTKDCSSIAMTKRDPLTWDRLPLFACDRDLGEAVLGWERRDEFKGLAILQERYGMPKHDMLWGGRYVPAVKAFLDHQYGIGIATAIPRAPRGIEESFHARRQTKESQPALGPDADEASRARYGYTDNNGNARRPASGAGKIKVTAPDGRSWIEDANETDPRLWHRKLPFKPKRKLTPRTKPEDEI
jgi:hypothetical protein